MMKKTPGIKVGLMAALLIGCILFYGLVGCPFRFVTDIPCPACGSTRAIVSLFRLDISGYFHYQPMAVPLAVSAVVLLFCNRRRKMQSVVFAISVAILNFIFYLYRLFSGFEF